jgi:SAM-dependent methyltransferase
MASTGATDPTWYLESGKRAFDQLSQLVPLAPAVRILDFGCGCGRLVRHLVQGGVDVVGVDPNGEAIAWCKRRLPGSFLRLPSRPPLTLAASSFDAVVALSVFTHLSVPAQVLWLAELSRLLRPGGRLLVSLHGRAFLGQLTAEQRALFDAGEIVVTWSAAEGSNLCAAYHPPGAFERLAATFRVVHYYPAGAAGNPPQDLLVLQPTQSVA